MSIKKNLNIAVIGHVDSGKSTFIGCLLSKLGLVSQNIILQNQKDAKKLGKESFYLAWNTDETKQERERGVTVDICHKSFETEKYRVEIIDCPGHKDYISNTITGISQADIAVLIVDVVDANKSHISDSSKIDEMGQVYEHIHISRILGVLKFIVLINKMDIVNYEENFFQETIIKIKKIFKKMAIKVEDVVFIPISAINGVNFQKNDKTKDIIPWFNGLSFLEALNNVEKTEEEENSDLRISVSSVFKIKNRTFQVYGKVESGSFKVPCNLMCYPDNLSITVLSASDENFSEFIKGSQICLTVKTGKDEDLEIGSILSNHNSHPIVSSKFKANLGIFELPHPLLIGTKMTLHYLQVVVAIQIISISKCVSKKSGEQKNPRFIQPYSQADVILQSEKPLAYDLYEKNKSIGRFVLRFKGMTIGTGKFS